MRVRIAYVVAVALLWGWGLSSLAQRGGSVQQPTNQMPACQSPLPTSCPSTNYFCLDSTATIQSCINNVWTAASGVSGISTVDGVLVLDDDVKITGSMNLGTISTFGDTDTTPSVASGIAFRFAHSSAKTVTAFDGGAASTTFVAWATNGNTTIDFSDAGSIRGNFGQDRVLADNSMMMCTYDSSITAHRCGVYDSVRMTADCDGAGECVQYDLTTRTFSCGTCDTNWSCAGGTCDTDNAVTATSFTADQHPSVGGSISAMEPASASGTDKWAIKVPDTGLDAPRTCTVEADGDIPISCLAATCGQASINPNSIAANTKGIGSVGGQTGLVAGDACACSMETEMDPGLNIINCYVSATDTLAIRIYNTTAGAINGGPRFVEYCCFH